MASASSPVSGFKLGIGGITGHKDFATDTGIIVKPEDSTKVSDAIVRVFIDLGDRTNRHKARLKYVIDGMGMEKFLPIVEEKLGAPFTRVPADALPPRPASTAWRISACTSRSRTGLNWIGVVLPLGKVTSDQMRGLSKIAADLGDGDIRLTVWQNLLIPGVKDDECRAGDCRHRSARPCHQDHRDPRRPHRLHRPRRLQVRQCGYQTHGRRRSPNGAIPRVEVDTPINIHLTGCHHSCAQHYISDIGIIGARIPVDDSDDTLDGFHIFTGGGFGPHADVGQEVYQNVKSEDAPMVVERLLKAYLAHRASPDETFLTFSRRHDGDSLAQARGCTGVRMNQMTPPPKIEIIPATAPFSEAQRSWLNGFFAGLLSDATVDAALGGAGRRDSWKGDGDDGEAPWHDQTMPIADRMKLAEGKPVRRRMMAAMAQQDCGQCGYNCNDYSDAIASKAEARLNLCVPGGKETARMLKSLYEELDKAPAVLHPGSDRRADRSAPAPDPSSSAARATIPRRRCFLAPPAQQAGSEKETWHIDFDLSRVAVSITSSAIVSASLRRTISAMSTRSSRCSARRI